MSKSFLPGDKLSDHALEKLAGNGAFERGKSYASHLRVVSLRRYRAKIHATVEGREDYNVCLWPEKDDRLGYSCTCPQGEKNRFCKHCVATALIWRREGKGFGQVPKREKTTPIRRVDLRTYLENLPKKELAERLLTLLNRNQEEFDAWKLEAAWCGSTPPDVPALKHAVRTWLWLRENGGNTGSILPKCIPRVEMMAGIIRQLMNRNYYDEALDVLDYIFRTAPGPQVVSYQADGEGDRLELLPQFQQFHFDICKKTARPPEQLAEELIDYQVEVGSALFADAYNTYSKLLGRKGRKVYLGIIEDMARNLEPLPPREITQAGKSDGRRQRLMRIVLDLEAPLPPEWYADVLSRDLESPEAFYTIAKKFFAAQNYEKALDWVSRGINEFELYTDTRLLVLGVDICYRENWFEKGMELAWDEFKLRPEVGTFAILKQLAEKLNNWKKVRRDIFTFIKNRQAGTVPKRVDKAYQHFGTRKDVSLLVDLHIADGEAKKADRLSRRGFCRDTVLLRLADALMRVDPARALSIYKKHLQQFLGDGRALSYNQHWREELRELLEKIKCCCEALDQPGKLYAILARVTLPRNSGLIYDSHLRYDILRIFSEFGFDWGEV